MTNRTRCRPSLLRLLAVSALLLPAGALLGPAASHRPAAPNWRTDPAWNQGKAEWAVYAATRPIYGQSRAYDATIFTNKQMMDPDTTTKAADWRAAGNVEVFKHNVSEIIPTENYDYRFLTTAFVRTGSLELFKLAISTQEDCGSTYKQFINRNRSMSVQSFSYFPDDGATSDRYRIPERLAMQDALSLTLRDYPFDADVKSELALQLVPDQTLARRTPTKPAEAIVRYVGRETISVPFGDIDAHQLRVEHRPDGGTSHSRYWFAADPALRHVLVKYQGPHGVRYELRHLDWWAYWNEPRPSRP